VVTDRDQPGLGIECAEAVELVTDYLERVVDEPLRVRHAPPMARTRWCCTTDAVQHHRVR